MERQSRAGILPNGEPCQDAAGYGSELWAEHDHAACLDVNTDEPLMPTVKVEKLTFRFATDEDKEPAGEYANRQAIGTVQGVGVEYWLYVDSIPEAPPVVGTPTKWRTEFFVLTPPPGSMFGTVPKRSQTFTSNLAMLAAIGADIDEDLAQNSDLDTESSASRQHYIDTGEYLTRGEAVSS